ncbi:hypothetical protein KIW84_052211 [Lathyrus oleraceus]|uniref:Uncharacterized protein n=1 Tax=Pisum sativum TaxID=3888 RepID=A0A9D4WPI5_PEA|nr:hypothetical protein KIW84_052211 [Pisum sativum]
MASELKRKDGAAGKGKEKLYPHPWMFNITSKTTPRGIGEISKVLSKEDSSNSLIRGKKIALTPNRLGQILDIPSGGHMLYDPEDEEWNDYNKREFYFGSSKISEGEYHEKRVESHGGEEPPKDFLSAGNFSINDRVLHYVLVYIIIPRNSNHCTITDMEIQALYAIKNDITLNWSHLILHHMMSHTTKLKSLPWA